MCTTVSGLLARERALRKGAIYLGYVLVQEKRSIVKLRSFLPSIVQWKPEK